MLPVGRPAEEAGSIHDRAAEATDAIISRLNIIDRR
jgi:hypothetical protein